VLFPLFAIALFACPQRATAQASVVFGGAIVGGTLQTPYVFNCSRNDPDSGAGGMVPYVGFGVGPVSVTAGYVQIRQAGSDDCLIDPPPSDGVHRVRDLRITHSSIYGWAFHLRYAPERLPFLVYTGSGYRFGGNELGGNPFVTIGAAARTTGRLSVFVGGEVTQLKTYSVHVDEVWQSGEIVSSTEVDDGYAWRKLKVIRVGLEYRWQLSGG